MTIANRGKRIILVSAVAAVLIFASWIPAKNAIAKYYLERGKYYLSQGNFEAAGKSFIKASKLNKKNPLPHYFLGKVSLGPTDENGDVFYPKSNYGKAIEYFETALKLKLENTDSELFAGALNDLGFSYWRMEEYEKAEEKFLKYISIAPEKAYIARYLLALHYFERKNKAEEALKLLEPTLSMVLRDFQKRSLYRVYRLLADLHYYFGDFEKTENNARIAVKLSEDRVDRDAQIAHTLLALAYGKRQNFSAAADEIQKANKLYAHSASQGYNVYGCQLAKAYFLGKDYLGANAIASSVNPPITSYGYPGCMFVLGETFLLQEDRSEAKKYFNKYLEATDKLEEKDIFIIRGRERAVREVAELSSVPQ